MVNLKTSSLVLKNKQKEENQVGFKNEKQEALYNRFI